MRTQTNSPFEFQCTRVKIYLHPNKWTTLDKPISTSGYINYLQKFKQKCTCSTDSTTHSIKHTLIISILHTHKNWTIYNTTYYTIFHQKMTKLKITSNMQILLWNYKQGKLRQKNRNLSTNHNTHKLDCNLFICLNICTWINLIRIQNQS